MKICFASRKTSRPEHENSNPGCFFSSDGVLELESSLKKPIRDDNPFLPLICGGIEAVLRQGLKSKRRR